MRYLIISDLHANWEALEAVVNHAQGQYDQTVCCGDLVGYGAEPNPVVQWVQANCAVTVRGNHDRACTGQEDLEWFNPVARAAAVWTLENLSVENIRYIRDLPQGPAFVDGVQVLHGSPCDEDDYLVGADQAAEAFNYLESRVAFFGHTHLQGGFIWNQERVETVPAISLRCGRQSLQIDASGGYLINPGSVGQPRDGDPRAAYAVYDSERSVVDYYRVDYDLETAQRKIREAGLPVFLAERLSIGR